MCSLITLKITYLDHRLLKQTKQRKVIRHLKRNKLIILLLY